MKDLNLITCIVQRGRAEKVVDAALKAGAPGATYYDPLQAASAEAGFVTVAHFHRHVEAEPDAEQRSFDPQELTDYIKAWGEKLGAAEVGIAQMHDFH